MLPVSGQGLFSSPNDRINPCQCGAFGYFFPDADPVAYTDRTLDALAALQKTMSGPRRHAPLHTPSHLPGLPHIFTSFGQFVDQDISSILALDAALIDITGPEVAPQPRAEIEASLVNARTGWLDLGGLYGDVSSGELRRGDARAKMRLAPFDTLHGALGTKGFDAADVGQLHFAFLRLHNAIVDAYPHARRVGDADAVFDWAKTQTRLTYQWLVLHAYLPEICDPIALAQVLSGQAALYHRFVVRLGVQPHHPRPLPLEFTMGGLRLEPVIAGARRPQYPDHLRGGVRMSLPSAQACIDVLNSQYGIKINALTVHDLCTGETGQAVRAGGFETATPLWFYLLKEAEIASGGHRLGALGTHIVAGTLAGLLISDPHSAWNTPGSVEGRWHPLDGVQPNGHVLDSFAGLMRVAGLMAAPAGVHA